MKIDIKDLKNDLDVYIWKAAHEDIDVYDGDHFRVRLTFPIEKKMELIDQLTGIIQTDEDIDIDKIREERFEERCGIKFK